jgi:hypothetical protein
MATMVHAVGLECHGGTMATCTTAAGNASVAKNVLLFFAAPFVGLAYIIAFPLVGTVAMLRMAVRH